jgi:ATP-dependent DNA helicase PIF1
LKENNSSVKENMTSCVSVMESFTEDQQMILDSYVEGKNIFITGPGGCGKSYIVKEIVRRATMEGKKIAVCATTGCASILLQCGAKTIHSWSGIGLARMSDEAITTKIMMNSNKRKNWRNTDILIIDEMSMMSKRMFELLNHIGIRVRKCGKPFGGIQLIASGDFYQLPPVGNMNDPDSMLFCFESPLWGGVFDEQVLLDKLFRQKDETYIDILHQVREGSLNKDAFDALNERVKRCKALDSSDAKYTVHLFPTKTKANEMNMFNLEKIDEPEKYFQAIENLPEEYEKTKTNTKTNTKTTVKSKTTTTNKDKDKHQFEFNGIYKNALFEKRLVLKKGCKVMCIVNLDVENEIVNGSVGTVIDFKTAAPKDDDGDGMECYPLVQFENGITKLITANSWMNDNQYEIKQIPLILAWGITIHKSQGATLNSAIIDLGRNVFESGQSYVALSRVKSLDGLYLTAFDATKIKANEKVKGYYELFYE